MESFGFSTWPAKSKITLANVPWNNDYRDLWGFTTSQQLNSFIDSGATPSTTLEDVSYLKYGEPIIVPLPFNTVIRYNYLRASNPAQPVPGNDVARDFYYFIIGAEYLSPNATKVVLQLDIWASFRTQLKFGNCYIERGHIGIANSRQNENRGRTFLSIPEGLDTGGDYQIIDKTSPFVRGFDAIITSTTNLTSAPGTQEFPLMQTAGGSRVQGGIYAGTESYVLDGRDVYRYFTAMSKYPWITSGIIRIVLVPKLDAFYPNYDASKMRIPKSGSYPPGPSGSSDSYLSFTPEHFNGIVDPPNVLTPPTADISKSIDDDVFAALPTRFRHLRKFNTFPYSFTMITNESGSQSVIKHELCQDTGGKVLLKQQVSYNPGSERLETFPHNYNNYRQSESPTVIFDRGEGVDSAVVTSNMPTLPAVNNMAVGALAGQAHSLAQARTSAEWSQAKNLYGNQLAYSNATAGMDNSQNQAAIARRADSSQVALANDYAQQTALVNGISSVVGGAIGGAAGGPGGIAVGAGAGLGNALMGAVGTGMQINNANSSLSIRNNASTDSANANYSTAAGIRDSNRAYADTAANGDYANTIAQIEAKVQDTQLTQPSMSSQFGGDMARLAIYGSYRVTMVTKLVDQNAINRIGNYWLRYGYAVQQFATPPADMHCMDRFTYWKLKETYLIDTYIPEQFKQAIRGIFETGVTVWKNAADIGKLDIGNNRPLTGISL